MDKNGYANLNKIETLIQMYGRNGYSVANYLTLADLYLYEVVTSCIHSHDLGALRNYPEIQRVRNSVESSPRVANYVKNRFRSRFY